MFGAKTLGKILGLLRQSFTQSLGFKNPKTIWYFDMFGC
jgi:hypothetical protein